MRKYRSQQVRSISLLGYHGTHVDFERFDLAKAGSATDAGALGTGFYFSTDPKVVSRGQRAIVAHLSLDDPLRLELPAWSSEKIDLMATVLGVKATGLNRETADALRQAACALGYDGVILDYSPVGYLHQEIVAFYPGQVRILERRGPVPMMVEAEGFAP